ncbi:MAG TPA: hypothetical protein VK599_04910, partial [Streptosporangiaceae bacterium]|nr:hypothetical protein [Streptosporangiaceae bacterium]
MEPSAVAARRTRASLALAVVGAIVLMAGVALVLSGEAIKLEHQARPPSLIGPGVVLAFLGLALGASAVVTILLDAPTRLPAAGPLTPAAPGDPSAFGPPAGDRSAFGPPPGDRSAFGRPAGDRSAFGPPPGDPVVHGEVVAGEVLSSDRLAGPVPLSAAAWTEVVPGAALSPPGRTSRGQASAGPASAGQASAGQAYAGQASAGPPQRPPPGGVPGAPGSGAPGSPAPGLVPGAREPGAGEV